MPRFTRFVRTAALCLFATIPIRGRASSRWGVARKLERVPALDKPQIVRIARAHVRPGCEPEFEQILESTTVPARSGVPGMLRLSRLRSTEPAEVTEYLIVTRWSSRAALERYKAASEPSIAPELAHTLLGGSIEEYEVFADDEYDI